MYIQWSIIIHTEFSRKTQLCMHIKLIQKDTNHWIKIEEYINNNYHAMTIIVI